MHGAVMTRLAVIVQQPLISGVVVAAACVKAGGAHFE